MRPVRQIELDGDPLLNVRGNLYPIDLAGNGAFGFVHFNGYRFMRVYDAAGRKLWQINNPSGRVHRDTIHRDTLAVVDADGDGDQDIVHCWAEGGQKMAAQYGTELLASLPLAMSIRAQADMSWVVVNDPVPAGAAILGTGLGRDSQILASGEKKQGWVWPAYEERKFDSFRAYYRFVPKGKWSVEYTARLNNAGEFLLPPTRVEAMYAPEMFGEMPNAKVKVTP